MNRIYLVRHGETEWNHTGKYQGLTDVPLSAKGIEQAKKCAKALQKVKIDHIISSDLSRALVTAQTINEGRNIPLSIDSGLREISFGDWEGLTYDQITEKWPGIIEEMYQNPQSIKISNGESFPILQKRAWAALQRKILAVDDEDTILVVCHGGTIRTLICQMLRIPLDFAWNFRQGNTAISYIDYYGEDSINTLGLLNNVDHLEGLL